MDGSTGILARNAAQPEIAPASNSDRAARHLYVHGHHAGTPFHLPAWTDAVESGLGHKAHTLVARRDGDICGILPLVHVRTTLFGNALISTGFSVGGGILADDIAAEHTLAARAAELARELNVDFLELRGATAAIEGWPTKSETYAGFRAALDIDEDARLKAIPRKRRADVRKGIKAGLSVEIDAPLDVFYDLYAQNLAKLGTPILSKRWYVALKQAFGDACEISCVHAEGAPQVALFTLYFRDQVLPYYVGASVDARRHHAFDHVYWSLMGRAVDRGATLFDFGRSKFGTGAFDYKKHWGFEPEPLAYQYHLVKANAVPDVNPNNPKYATFVKAWQRMPLWATRLVGPSLARQLG